MQRDDFKKNWKEIVSGFLKLGATAYGGPAIYGILQAELQEKVSGYLKNASSKGFP